MEDKMIKLQNQVRQNQHELSDYIKELGDWEDSMKEKDVELRNQSSADSKTLPPVRNILQRKLIKKKPKPAADEKQRNKPARIPGSDFKAWDKFDVEKACAEIDDADDEKKSESEYETDEDWEDEKRRQQALIEKDRGNAFFKNAEYDAAVESYTAAIEFDPTNAVLPANRAMALIKQQKFAAAETDCTLSLSLNPLYVKAFLRRGSAREHLGKTAGAIFDYETVLKIDPENKLAAKQLKAIKRPSSSTVSESSNVEKMTNISAESEIFDEQQVKGDDTEMKAVSSRRIPPTNLTKVDNNSADDVDETEIIMSQKQKEAKKRAGPIDVISGQQRHAAKPDKTQSKQKPMAKQKEVKTAKTSPRQPREIPAIPQSSYQFHCDWKELRQYPEKLYEYMSSITPSEYPRLIGQFLDADMFISIVDILKFYIRDGLSVYPVFIGLSQVDRFSLVLMFLSQQNKQAIKEILLDAKESGNYNEDRHKMIIKSYSVK